jgi:membrane protein DedA with SNARE-associated domain
MDVNAWLESIPPLWILVVVTLVVGIESLGVPLPGELVLVGAALLAARGVVDPVAVGACAAAGAIVGDSIGYAIGRRGGRALIDRLGRRFPAHLGPEQIKRAERTFERWGVGAVFVGRFIALLRILAGPLAGALRMPYRRFLLANAGGGIVWAGGTTAVIYYAGRAAEAWLQRFAWVGLVLAVLSGLITTAILRRRMERPAPPAP